MKQVRFVMVILLVAFMVTGTVFAGGGREAQLGLASLHAVASIERSGESFQVELFKRAPNLFRINRPVGDFMIVQAYDGERMWAMRMKNGRTDGGEWLPNEPYAEMIRDAPITSHLLDYKGKGNKARLVGQEYSGDDLCYVIAVELPDGTELFYYVDVELFLERKVTMAGVTDQGVVEKEYTFEDYREVDGVKVPYLTRSLEGGKEVSIMRLEDISFNVGLLKQFFMMPDTLDVATAEKN